MIKEVPMSPHDLFIDLGSGKRNTVITSIQLFLYHVLLHNYSLLKLNRPLTLFNNYLPKVK